MVGALGTSSVPAAGAAQTVALRIADPSPTLCSDRRACPALTLFAGAVSRDASAGTVIGISLGHGTIAQLLRESGSAAPSELQPRHQDRPTRRFRPHGLESSPGARSLLPAALLHPSERAGRAEGSSRHTPPRKHTAKHRQYIAASRAASVGSNVGRFRGDTARRVKSKCVSGRYQGSIVHVSIIEEEGRASHPRRGRECRRWSGD